MFSILGSYLGYTSSGLIDEITNNNNNHTNEIKITNNKDNITLQEEETKYEETPYVVYRAVPDEDLALYHHLTCKLREFFLSKSFMWVPGGSRLSLLAACEEPQSVRTFDYLGTRFAKAQTNQMNLEQYLLENQNRVFFETNQKVQGYISESASFREEANPIPGRHWHVFDIFEFEMFGNFDDLLKLEEELLIYLGYDKPVRITYHDALIEVGKDPVTGLIDSSDEQKLYEKHGHAVLLYNFPEISSPFFNMARDQGIAKKCDVILSGFETIGSAERSIDVNQMKECFYTISNGEYATSLFKLFGKERVERELNDFLSLKPFVQRVGGGCGLNRLLRSYKMLQESQNKVSHYFNGYEHVCQEIKELPTDEKLRQKQEVRDKMKLVCQSIQNKVTHE